MDDKNDIDMSDIAVTTSPSVVTIDISNINETDYYISNKDWLDADFDTSLISTEEFRDRMPDISKIEDMCKEYPGLKIAYENFKSIYKMVHQDWQGKQKE